MKQKGYILSAEEEDFLREMMSIGSGWAATALTQLLRTSVETVIPRVKSGALGACLPSAITDPGLPVSAVKMHMLGACTGDIFFIIPAKELAALIHQLELVSAEWLTADMKSAGAVAGSPSQTGRLSEMAASMIVEIGNILVGVYLRAIYDFCRLSIVHSMPVMATDMIQALLDESLAEGNLEDSGTIMVESAFMVGAEQIISYLLLVPSAESVKVLARSITDARAACFGTE